MAVTRGTGSLAGRVPAPSCRVCGRVLRSDASRARGVGPVCFRAPGGRTAIRVRAARIPTPTPDHHVPGQTELPLQILQPTLWSL
ncbi:DUF6011 domain-containing protein [Streptomyces sp. NBC_01383]|uniref:DUF6011 domain-containing protein n=1 Tax=Streptomyces sp. NBC_01383 TaxID=2903846 RepID=UPI003868BB09